jgi:phenylacetate-CoA ligase
MFVRPEQVEAANPDPALREAVNATLRSVTKLGGNVAWVAPQSLPNDGKAIADERT